MSHLRPLLSLGSLVFAGAVLLLPPSGSIAVAEDKKEESTFDPAPVVSLFELLISDQNSDPATARQCLGILAGKIQSRELSPAQVEQLKPRMERPLGKIIAQPDHPLFWDAALLAATWKHPVATTKARELLAASKEPSARRLAALEALLAAGDSQALDGAATILANHKDNPAKFRAEVLAALGRSEDARVAEVVLSNYDKFEADQQPKAIELLTQRVSWSKSLLEAIGANKIPAAALNVNQVAKLQASRDPDLTRLVTAKWGTVRTQRNPQREQVVADMKAFIHRTPGDAEQGQIVFKRVCAQCHKIHGEGNDVGPDITSNGRNDFNQLLSNVFDPSLVIGAAYQARMIRTNDGRVLTGIPSEDSEQRVVLKLQGGKQEIIARDDIDSMKTSELSLMPEGLEKQLQPQEIADLFAFLILDKPPSDPAAKQLPGVYESK